MSQNKTPCTPSPQHTATPRFYPHPRITPLKKTTLKQILQRDGNQQEQNTTPKGRSAPPTEHPEHHEVLHGPGGGQRHADGVVHPVRGEARVENGQQAGGESDGLVEVPWLGVEGALYRDLAEPGLEGDVPAAAGAQVRGLAGDDGAESHVAVVVAELGQAVVHHQPGCEEI